MAMLEVRNLGIQFGGLRAVDDFNITIEKGALYGLNSNRKERYWGNKTWRTTGKNWSYAYQLRQVGVIVPPILRTIGK